MKFEEILPTSFEVTFIPLVLAYVWFGLGMAINTYVAMIGPLLYLLLCVFFIAPETLNGFKERVFLLKLLFTLLLV